MSFRLSSKLLEECYIGDVGEDYRRIQGGYQELGLQYVSYIPESGGCKASGQPADPDVPEPMSLAKSVFWNPLIW